MRGIAGVRGAFGIPGAVPVVEVQDLEVVRGGRPIVAVDHLSVASGETLAVVGPNGAGKTTLLLALAGLLRPHSGRLLFRGSPVGRGQELAYRRRLGLVMPDPLLLDATVFANVALGLRFRGTPTRRIEEQVTEWLGRLRIGHLRDRHARGLSSGEAQRVSLARALVLEPVLLLLDEPFASVDAATRIQLVEDLAELLEANRVTCVVVTHDLDEAARLGDRMAVILGGRIRQVGPPEAVMASPADEEVAAFVGVETRVRGVVTAVEHGIVVVDVEGQPVEVTAPAEAGVPGAFGGGPPAGTAKGFHPSRPVLFCLRPGDVTLWVDGGPAPGASSARNRLRGRIARVTPQGSTVRVTVDCGFPLVALVTRASADEMGLAESTEVTAVFKASAAHLIALTS
jgi:tungstate transport system ATP-binding protein